MSAQSVAKAMQGYQAKPNKCANCQHIDIEKIADPVYRGYFSEKFRCDIGKFAVKKMATCLMFTSKVTP